MDNIENSCDKIRIDGKLVDCDLVKSSYRFTMNYLDYIEKHCTPCIYCGEKPNIYVTIDRNPQIMLFHECSSNKRKYYGYEVFEEWNKNNNK